MADYKQDAVVEASAPSLFDYLADVRNLPKYFDAMTDARPGDGSAVETTARVNGEEKTGEAWFEVDRQARTISWGSEGPHDYHGQLKVFEDGPDSSVSVSLHTERVDSDEIDRGLRATLANIKELVEGLRSA